MGPPRSAPNWFSRDGARFWPVALRRNVLALRSVFCRYSYASPWSEFVPCLVTIETEATFRYSAFWFPLSILNSCRESGAGMFASAKFVTPELYAELPLAASFKLTPLRVKLLPPQYELPEIRGLPPEVT